jgi:rhamnose transport system substrate-binding protein
MTVKVVAPAQAGATDQIPFIEAAIQQKVDAIAVSPNDASALCPTLKRAMKAGIIVLAVNGDVDSSLSSSINYTS